MNRIQSVADADYSVQSHSLDLINVLIRNCGILSRQDILYTLDSLNLRQACLTQLQRRGPVVQELSKQLLEFQCLLVTEFHNRKNRTVSSGSGSITSERHEDMIRFIWSASGMTVNGPLKWRKMGFATENVKREFDKVGVLGLELVQTFVERNTDLFIKVRGLEMRRY